MTTTTLKNSRSKQEIENEISKLVSDFHDAEAESVYNVTVKISDLVMEALESGYTIGEIKGPLSFVPRNSEHISAGVDRNLLFLVYCNNALEVFLQMPPREQRKIAASGMVFQFDGKERDLWRLTESEVEIVFNAETKSIRSETEISAIVQAKAEEAKAKAAAAGKPERPQKNIVRIEVETINGQPKVKRIEGYTGMPAAVWPAIIDFATKMKTASV